MKNKLFRLAAALLLAFALLCAPAAASSTWGVIYDETESLGSETLTYLGEEQLPMFSEQLGIDMRVDVLTLMSAETIADAAAAIYRNYDYGFGETERGVTLTILMKRTEGDSYAMAPGGWCVYVGGEDPELADGALLEAATAAVEPYMAERAWNGEDMTMSATALTQAVQAMLDAVADYFLGSLPDDEPAPPEPTEDLTAAAEPEYLALRYVMDLAGRLDFEEWKALETRAAAIAAQYGCGVYAVTVDNFADYGPDIETVVEDIWRELEIGEGDGRDGIVLLLSIDSRDFATFASGERAEYAFSDYAQQQLEEVFLDNLADNDWHGGISDYLETCGSYLALAESGRPVRANPLPRVILAVVIAVVVALVICLILKGKMKSVRRGTEASAYVAAGGLKLTARQDLYTHTTETRRKIESKSSSGSSGFSGGDGGSGRSGKF